MKKDIYIEVSNRIAAELEAGAVPWVKPWSATAGENVPANAATGRPYSGCNVVLLWMACASAGYATPRFLTYRHAQELGGQVRKGEHGHKVYFVKRLIVKDNKRPDDENAERMIPMMREYTVFNISQVDGLPERVLTPPPAKPGHRSRLDRDLRGRFGEKAYAAEELVAELGAAFLCAEFSIDGDLRHAGYIASWIGLLRDDPRAFFTACSNAQAAADFLRGKALADSEPMAIAA